jgi:hypothetical protein
VVPADALTVMPNLHPPPLRRGKPTPTPTVAPAAVTVTLIVPDAFTVNERVLWPAGATVLDQLSLIVDEVLLGVVGELLSLPHAPEKTAAITSHEDTKARRRNIGALMGV